MKKKQGFAAISPEKRKEIARMGGKAAHAKGVAHEWNSEEARIAGRRGGLRTKEDYERRVYGNVRETSSGGT